MPIDYRTATHTMFEAQNKALSIKLEMAVNLNEALKAANEQKDQVIKKLCAPLDVFEITDKMMLLPRYEHVKRALIGEIVNDIVKIIECS
jgi:hypothetical protein